MERDGWMDRDGWNGTPRSGVGGGRGVGRVLRDPLLLIAPKRSKTEQRTLNSALKRSIDPLHGLRVAIRATVLPARVSIASTIRFIIVEYALPLIQGLRPLLFPFLSPSIVYIREKSAKRGRVKCD